MVCRLPHCSHLRLPEDGYWLLCLGSHIPAGPEVRRKSQRAREQRVEMEAREVLDKLPPPGQPAPAGSGGPPTCTDRLPETGGPRKGSWLLLPCHPAPPDTRLSQLCPGECPASPAWGCRGDLAVVTHLFSEKSIPKGQLLCLLLPHSAGGLSVE